MLLATLVVLEALTLLACIMCWQSLLVAAHNPAATAGFVQMSDIRLLIFDEAHHCNGDHPYAQIMEDFYHVLQHHQRPQVTVGTWVQLAVGDSWRLVTVGYSWQLVTVGS